MDKGTVQELSFYFEASFDNRFLSDVRHDCVCVQSHIEPVNYCMSFAA
jgi:hypothetical protein